MTPNPQSAALPRTNGAVKIAGAFGIAFGFFAGTGVSGLAMGLSLCGLWALLYGLSAKGHPLGAALKHALARSWPQWLIFAAMVGWIVYAASWSLAPKLAGETVRRLLTIAVLGPLAVWAVVQAAKEDADAGRRSVIVAFVFPIGILIFELLSHFGLNMAGSPGKELKAIEGDMGRAASATLTLFWACYASIYQRSSRKNILVFLVLAAGLVSLQFGTDINAVGLVTGTIAALFALSFPRVAVGIITAIAAVLVAAAPLLYPHLAHLAQAVMPSGLSALSYGRRAQMWEVASNLIQQKPLTGWGLGSASTFDKPILYGGYEWPLIQLHPHSAPLHIWLETGAVGALLIASMIVFAGLAAANAFRRQPIAAAALVGGLCFLTLNWGFSHSAWREWVWTSFAALIAFSLALRQPLKSSRIKADDDEVI